MSYKFALPQIECVLPQLECVLPHVEPMYKLECVLSHVELLYTLSHPPSLTSLPLSLSRSRSLDLSLSLSLSLSLLLTHSRSDSLYLSFSLFSLPPSLGLPLFCSNAHIVLFLYCVMSHRMCSTSGIIHLVFVFLLCHTECVLPAHPRHQCMCVTSHIHMCETPDAFTCVTWPTNMWGMTHSYVWHNSFICVIQLIHMCDITHSYMWHNPFICVT